MLGSFYLSHAEVIEIFCASTPKPTLKQKEKYIEDIKKDHKLYRNMPIKDKLFTLETPVLLNEKFDGSVVDIVCGPNSWLVITCK